MRLSRAREFYVSSKGDRWEIGRDPTGHLQIMYRPNSASGVVNVTDVGTFLVSRQPGPVHDALLDLLRNGTLDAAPRASDG